MAFPTEPDGPSPAAVDTAVPDEVVPEAATAAGGPAGKPRRRPSVRAAFRSIAKSRKGIFVLLILIGGFASAVTVGGVVAVGWTETADFCGRCHTMDPELKAHELSAHREIACAECHVEPGVDGWIRAKVNGTRQLLMVLTGTFSAPIPAPDHGDLPPTSATCARCHDADALAEDGGPVKLILTERFNPDKDNSRDTVALVLRPAGLGGPAATRGVHWHVAEDVEYTSPDPRAQTIDYVSVRPRSGVPKEFLASSAVTSSSDVGPDIDHILSEQRLRRMDCIDCHNRVGHGVPALEKAIDSAITSQRIDRTLPYIKREAMDRMAIEYASQDDADHAIEGIRSFYETRYPLLAKNKAQEINASIDDLKRIYRLVATPDMRVTAATYPDNLGHTSAPGCFRCHDGAHYRVVNGALTQETIPSACATCHTFPQIGSIASGVLVGERPSNHDDRLWVFDHKTEVAGVDPAGSSCGACHTRTYCQNCHDTEAVNVPHDDMVYSHAAVMEKTGAQACAYCHQPAYCAQCHSEEVMPDPYKPVNGSAGGTTTEPTAEPP